MRLYTILVKYIHAPPFTESERYRIIELPPLGLIPEPQFFLKNSLDGHRLGRHDKSIIGNGNAATDNSHVLKA